MQKSTSIWTLYGSDCHILFYLCDNSDNNDFLLRRAKFLLSLSYLLFYLLPLVPSENYRIVLRPRQLDDQSQAPDCHKGPDDILKIVLHSKNSSMPKQAMEMCGVDTTVDEERLLSEWNTASILTFFSTRSSNAALYHTTTVFEVVSLGPDGQPATATTTTTSTTTTTTSTTTTTTSTTTTTTSTTSTTTTIATTTTTMTTTTKIVTQTNNSANASDPTLNTDSPQAEVQSPVNDEGLYCLFVVPPTRACDISALEAAAGGEEGFHPVFLSLFSNFTSPTQAFLDGSTCLKLEYGGKFPKLCGLKSSMILTTAKSRADNLHGIYNFPFNNNRTLLFNKFKTCQTDQATREAIQTSTFFNLDDNYSFTKPGFSAMEYHQVGYVAITRPPTESKGLVFIETVPGTATEEDFVSFSGFVFFESGDEEVHFPIGIKLDTEDEPREYFEVKITTGNHEMTSRDKRSPTNEEREAHDSDKERESEKTRLSISSAQSGKNNFILRFDPEVVKERIVKQWITENKIKKKVFLEGYEALQEAVTEGTLQPGMSIWQAVPFAPRGLAQNFLSAIFRPNTMIHVGTGQSREFKYFHVAVYVGKAEVMGKRKSRTKYYVVENGGAGDDGRGQISLETFETAFHDRDSNHKYFLVTPPKEREEETGPLISTREKVAIKALGSLGVEYTYDMDSVNCEAFASALYRLKEWNPVQTKVIKDRQEKKFKNWSPEKKAEKAMSIKIFQEALLVSQSNFEEWLLTKKHDSPTLERIWARVVRKMKASPNLPLVESFRYQWWEDKIWWNGGVQIGE